MFEILDNLPHDLIKINLKKETYKEAWIEEINEN
jgi:hypothetical protein